MFIRDMTGGKGFIGMAAATIAGASPVGSALLAVVFGVAEAVTNYSKLYITDAQFLSAMPYIITTVLLFILSYIRMKNNENDMRKRKAAALKAHQNV